MAQAKLGLPTSSLWGYCSTAANQFSSRFARFEHELLNLQNY